MKNKAMITRSISGAVLLALVLCCGYMGGLPLILFCGIAGTVGLFEAYSALGVYTKGAEKKNNLLAYTGIVAAVVLYLIIYSGIIPYFAMGGNYPTGLESGDFFAIISAADSMQKIIIVYNVLIILAFTILMLVAFMAIYVFNFSLFTFEKVAYAYVGFVYVPVFMIFVYLTRTLPGNGIFAIWLIFICAWVCDTCAYFTGVSIGKHKLAPVLSPKKSIEGSVGGVVGAVAVAFLFGYFVQYKLFGRSNNALQYMIICAFGAIASQVGDLAASGIKRNHDIKDYGNLIPGHGGILDRFDSVIFVAPVIFILSALTL